MLLHSFFDNSEKYLCVFIMIFVFLNLFIVPLIGIAHSDENPKNLYKLNKDAKIYKAGKDITVGDHYIKADSGFESGQLQLLKKDPASLPEAIINPVNNSIVLTYSTVVRNGWIHLEQGQYLVLLHLQIDDNRACLRNNTIYINNDILKIGADIPEGIYNISPLLQNSDSYYTLSTGWNYYGGVTGSLKDSWGVGTQLAFHDFFNSRNLCSNCHDRLPLKVGEYLELFNCKLCIINSASL